MEDDVAFFVIASVVAGMEITFPVLHFEGGVCLSLIAVITKGNLVRINTNLPIFEDNLVSGDGFAGRKRLVNRHRFGDFVI